MTCLENISAGRSVRTRILWQLSLNISEGLLVILTFGPIRKDCHFLQKVRLHHEYYAANRRSVNPVKVDKFASLFKCTMVIPA